jgi:hypothetical protein
MKLSAAARRRRSGSRAEAAFSTGGPSPFSGRGPARRLEAIRVGAHVVAGAGGPRRKPRLRLVARARLHEFARGRASRARRGGAGGLLAPMPGRVRRVVAGAGARRRRRATSSSSSKP